MTRDAEIIRARVRDALDADVSEDYVLQFLTDLRNNMRDAERRTRRTTGFILLLATVFELINRHGISEATLVFVKLNSLDFASIVIPVVIAYLCYEITGHVTDSNDLYWVHAKVTEARYPSVRASNLDLLLIPIGDPFGQAIRAATFSRRGRLFTLLSWARFPPPDRRPVSCRVRLRGLRAGPDLRALRRHKRLRMAQRPPDDHVPCARRRRGGNRVAAPGRRADDRRSAMTGVGRLGATMPAALTSRITIEPSRRWPVWTP